MNELFDKLILRALFTVIICLALVGYRYIHTYLYPMTVDSKQGQTFFPLQNSAYMLHLFARIIGLGIIFSEFSLQISHGILIAFLGIFIKIAIVFLAYLISVYVFESMTLYNFEFQEEILKKENVPYALVDFAQSISIAFVLKTVLGIAGNALLLFVLLWLFAVVLSGFVVKTFHLVSKINFSKTLSRKELAVSISYLGFIWGWTVVVCASLEQEMNEVKFYIVQVLLHILLSVIILPIFLWGIKWAYRLRYDYMEKRAVIESNGLHEVGLGYGVFEGAYFFTACFLTTVVTGNIEFGRFYPFF